MAAAGNPPRMIVLAGPIASGKTTRFRELQELLDVDTFNVDDRCAELNGGSYQNIPDAVGTAARAECEAFVRRHVEGCRSFMVETTFRTPIALEQARSAAATGFRTDMIFVAVDDVRENIRRATVREAGGGRTVDDQTIRDVHRAALEHLVLALRQLDRVRVVDNTGVRGACVLETRGGAVTYRRESAGPEWLRLALRGTEFDEVRRAPVSDLPALVDIDPSDAQALARWNEQQLEDGRARVGANIREMQAKGILDEHGNRVRKDLPAEMMEGDKDCDIA